MRGCSGIRCQAQKLKTPKYENQIMACNCKIYQRRLDKLQKKYAMLKKNHRKLLGVAVLLTETVEEFLRGEVKTGINDTLSTCFSMYPDLVSSANRENEETDDLKPQRPNDQIIEIVNENGKVLPDPATESEREYHEGFMARPKIPRTPQV